MLVLFPSGKHQPQQQCPVHNPSLSCTEELMPMQEGSSSLVRTTKSIAASVCSHLLENFLIMISHAERAIHEVACQTKEVEQVVLPMSSLLNQAAT